MYSVNQVTQFYVCTCVNSTNTHVSDTDVPGTLAWGGNKDHFYFEHLGNGGITRSPLMSVGKTMWATVAPADYLKVPLKKWKLEIKPGITVKPFENYILKMKIKQFNSLDERSTFSRFGSAKVEPGDDNSKVLAKIATNFAKSYSRREPMDVEVFLNGTEKVTRQTKLSELKDTYTSIEFHEVMPFWKRGRMPIKTLNAEFTVNTDVTGNPTDAFVWAVYDEDTNTLPQILPHTKFIKDGYTTADMEWFFMGERNGNTFPGNDAFDIGTEYMVDPNKEYDMVTIHYYFSDSGTEVQKSEQTLIVALPKDLNITQEFLDSLKAVNPAIALTYKAEQPSDVVATVNRK